VAPWSIVLLLLLMPAGWNLFFFLLFIKTDGVLWFIIKNELQICNSLEVPEP